MKQQLGMFSRAIVIILLIFRKIWKEDVIRYTILTMVFIIGSFFLGYGMFHLFNLFVFSELAFVIGLGSGVIPLIIFLINLMD